SCIGSGAYGGVYHARWKGNKVAIKRYLLTADEADQSRVIQHEINAVQRLVHRHIIRFHDAADYQGQLVLITDYADGGSLQQAIEGRRVADWSIKERIAHEMAQGLDYMHSIGVLHRDLRSSNVLLTRQLQVKICDIGLATVKARSASKSTSSSKSIHHWMAPELLTDRSKHSTKSDMFALGVTMWEMAANCTVPLQERLDNHSVTIDLNGGARLALPDDTPPNYRHWVERCWEHDPDKRPQASEMVARFSEPETTSAIQAQGAVAGNSPSSIRITEEKNGGVSQPTDDVGPLWTRANAGDVGAQVALATKYENGIGVDPSDTEAFKWYLRAAGLGSTAAQYKIGTFSMNGRGTVRNDTIAVFWLQRAAEGAHAVAQNELGWMYQNGRGVERDDMEAFSWFHKSAVQGDPMAQCNLGSMYENGHGVEQDHKQASYWYRKSADQGNAFAQGNLGWLYQSGRAGEQDSRQALAWFHKAAKQGDSYAQCSLGWMYQYCHGVEQDYSQALEWYRKAADQEDVDAQNSLGWMYQYGQGTKQDYSQALVWYRKAAAKGDDSAQNNLGLMYHNGLGIEQDYSLALEWFRKSADQGNAQAQNNIGLVYRKGRGVEQNHVEAYISRAEELIRVTLKLCRGGRRQLLKGTQIHSTALDRHIQLAEVLVLTPSKQHPGGRERRDKDM
ncbi:hypothetical protein DFQ27_009971, partial [Actinomortierella ambigua]